MPQKVGNLREELIGHSTLAVLGVLGLALYSTTYSLVYAGSSSTTPVVAVLEMWMVTIHMVSPVLCGTAQALLAAELKRPSNHMAEAQTSLFLGIACIVTILGSNCVRDGGNVSCSAFYGAAAIPRFAAAGSIAWVWVMYVSSLGCQSAGISIGLSGKSALTAASIVLLVPYCIVSKLGSTCGGTVWTAPLCDNSACGIAGPILVIILSFLLSHGGSWLIAIHQRALGVIFSLLGPSVMAVGSFALWAAQNGNAQGSTQHILVAVFSTLSLISAMRHIPKGKKQRSKTGLLSLFSGNKLLSKKPLKATSKAISTSLQSGNNNTTTRTRVMFPTNAYQKIG